MKSIYIIITPTIKNAGGSQIYSLNKVRFMQKQGFSTYIFHANIGRNWVIEELKQYERYGIDEFKFPAQYFTNHRRSRIINKIITNVEYSEVDRVIIESHTEICATWGEMVADRMSAKHIVYLLTEYPHIKQSARGFFDFLHYKLERKELVGISKVTLKQLFKGWLDIPEDKCYALPATCSNTLGEIHWESPISFNDYDYIAGSIGRLDKPFVIPMIKEFLSFANKHQENSFLFVFVGGGGKSRVKSIKKLFERTSNVALFVTGEIYPIPINLIKEIDVFLSIAGSCKVSSTLGKPTISFDANDSHPIGIVGVTTNNTTYRSINEPIIGVTSLLQEILINKKYKEGKNIQLDIAQMNNIDFTNHLDFLASGTNDNCLYDISAMTLTMTDIIKKTAIKVLGINFFFELKTILF